MQIRVPPNDIDPLCDFCSDRSTQPVAALLVKTREFRLDPDDGVRRVSEGEWYVCRTCLDLILAHDHEALRIRAVDTFLAKNVPFSRHAEMRRFLMRDLPTVHRAALDQLHDWPTRY